ncbi:pimeloyl-ACP methyl ester carboxylesterase [Sulfitobacter undariae]|uniref:Pimeloyl-ACP methyl ester carboxylesterase n=1 Tax=Sulfitobacter undariae TaxID=1563671 RepID=A0A7W6E772_9RHOB|nr:alpha/beta fold hydrolase [Sulfitobacter undariae]MBB3993013.1 pimeloyl-ACP methyl ester carboxylesterase [Sulfitobacter undariae]
MPLVHVNASGQKIALHGSATEQLSDTIAQACATRGPTIIMVHGFKYAPYNPAHCPHRHLFHAKGWPADLGMAQHDTLGIAFGWEARGKLATVYTTALEQAQNLARLVKSLRPRGPVHLIGHSLGATLCLAALPYLNKGDIGRIVLLSGAAHLGLARHALDTPAGRSSEVIHVTSRENKLFDLGFEHLIPCTGSIARGIARPQAVQLHIDCAKTLDGLADLGYPIAAPRRRICHWSSYTRPGVMALNAALLTGRLPVSVLKCALPAPAAPRNIKLPYFLGGKTRSNKQTNLNIGPIHDPAY